MASPNGIPCCFIPGNMIYNLLPMPNYQHNNVANANANVTNDQRSGMHAKTKFQKRVMLQDHVRRAGKWTRVTQGRIPDKAVEGGVDEHGATIYVGRADIQNGVIPGTVHQSGGMCCVPYDGREWARPAYQVLANPNNLDLIWVPASNGDVPAGAIEGGRDPNGENYFIGRFNHQGTVRVGKVHCSHRACYIPHNGAEVASRNYEVLALKKVRVIMDESDDD